MTTADAGLRRRQSLTPVRAAAAAVHRHEGLRAALRAALAAGLAYSAGRLLGVPDLTWSVISALYVLQTSVGGTVNSAFGRMLGTAFGIAAGLTALVLAGAVAFHELAALVLAVALIGAAGEARPQLRYGAVVAAILLISPGDEDILVAALEKAYSIGLGSLVGALVGTFLFPVSAHRSALRHLSMAVRECGTLAGEALARERGDAAAWEAANGRVEREMEKARQRLGESRWASRDRMRDFRETARGVERLWHQIATLWRMADEARAEAESDGDLRQLLDGSRRVSCEMLEAIADAMDGRGDDLARLDERDRELRRLTGDWDARAERAGSRIAGSQAVLAFGLRQLRAEIEGLLASVDGRSWRQSRG